MTKLEKHISEKLRDLAMQEVETRGLDDEELADLLDVFPDGARRLRHNHEWSVVTGLTVLDKMGVRVDVTTG